MSEKVRQPERVWSDLYGCARALWAGWPGGHSWLLVAPPDVAEEVARELSGLSFKGSLHLLVTHNLTPLEAALREVGPRGALIVGRTLSGGPELDLPARTVEQGGFAYREGGPLPAWASALDVNAPQSECAPASLCAQVGVPVVSAAPGDFIQLLQAWWARTPHSLIYG